MSRSLMGRLTVAALLSNEARLSETGLKNNKVFVS